MEKINMTNLHRTFRKRLGQTKMTDVFQCSQIYLLFVGENDKLG